MNIIIADDHPIVRQGLIKMIERDAMFTVIGQADNGEVALTLLRQQAADIAVIDLAMPKMKGLDVIRCANEENIAVEFAVLTMFREEIYFNEAMDLGVKGYVLKESAVGELTDCLRTVAEGKYYISPLISDLMVKRTASLNTLLQNNPSLRELTPMEKKILRLIAENRTSKAIGEELYISYRTVQKHRTNICQKLGLQGHNRLLEYAIEHKHAL